MYEFYVFHPLNCSRSCVCVLTPEIRGLWNFVSHARSFVNARTLSQQRQSGKSATQCAIVHASRAKRTHAERKNHDLLVLKKRNYVQLQFSMLQFPKARVT